ncbi:helix-turn-helix domain-containing protein [Amycolatopsis suaedae]|uniref:XRE family transcriptional regulator n=1 Tax=Amycolatopsis suaedae TaxID=2510978 RepID=A0A4Q7IYK1_9PSEU|nr:helix-turn-helix transcriptional regulator [Amycolatopsis suaedae]RZQ59517.1 XRE family transcriptional regulator [Amycolatopsis suaedae]
MPESSESAGLAQRLDELFRRGRPGGERWTNDEVAAAIKRLNPDIKVSGTYLSALRTGKRTRPSPELQLALAKFFGVSPAYFFDPGSADKISQQLAALDELHQSGVRSLAARAVGLSPDNLDALKTVVDQMRKMQGLPPVVE